MTGSRQTVQAGSGKEGVKKGLFFMQKYRRISSFPLCRLYITIRLYHKVRKGYIGIFGMRIFLGKGKLLIYGFPVYVVMLATDRFLLSADMLRIETQILESFFIFLLQMYIFLFQLFVLLCEFFLLVREKVECSKRVDV